MEKLFELVARHLADGNDVNLAGFGKLTGDLSLKPPIDHAVDPG
ncbi:MAG: hypothetical protein ACLP0J_24960 [Solirubrobacteraceae bacterium]